MKEIRLKTHLFVLRQNASKQLEILIRNLLTMIYQVYARPETSILAMSGFIEQV